MPIIETLKKLSQSPDYPFYTPGHKRGKGIADSLSALLGKQVFTADLPELPELDNLFAPEGVIEEAQQLAAETFGAEQTWFLVNGSSCGIMAAILATCNPGDQIIVPRNLHQSVIAGLIHSGAIPLFIAPEYDGDWDLTLGISPATLRAMIARHPDVKAIFLLYPTYHGIGGDMDQLIQIAHDYHLPVLVDEAHGAHFAFHQQLPPSALSLGADLVVQSTHKVLGAMTQASMLHVQGERIDRDRLRQALQLVQSSSPSYLLLASLDAARYQMANQGEALMTHTLQLAEFAIANLQTFPALKVLQLPAPRPGFAHLDRTRLTVSVQGLGLTGFEVDERLRQDFGVTAELPMLHHLAFIISLGNREEDIKALISAFRQLSTEAMDYKSILPKIIPPPVAPLRLSPREAFFAPTQIVPCSAAIGQLSADCICPYPPGIPVLMPGEEITAEAIAYLQQVAALGSQIIGVGEGGLTQLRIIAQ